MSKREDFAINQSKILELNSQADSIRDTSYERETANQALVPQIIEEEKLLNGSTWVLKTGRHSPYLEYLGSIKDEEMSKIVELTCNSYHSSFVFEKGIEIFFDDSRVSLQFDDLKQIPMFIKKMGIIIDIAPIRAALQKLRKDSLVLEMICHQLQLIA